MLRNDLFRFYYLFYAPNHGLLATSAAQSINLVL